MSDDSGRCSSAESLHVTTKQQHRNSDDNDDNSQQLHPYDDNFGRIGDVTADSDHHSDGCYDDECCVAQQQQQAAGGVGGVGGVDDDKSRKV